MIDGNVLRNASASERGEFKNSLIQELRSMEAYQGEDCKIYHKIPKKGTAKKPGQVQSSRSNRHGHMDKQARTLTLGKFQRI